MAVSHIAINKSASLGGRLYSAIDRLQSALSELNELKDAMPGMVDNGDHSHLETQFGFDVGRGELAKGELESMLFKLNTNTSVTDVNAAMHQVFNYFA